MKSIIQPRKSRCFLCGRNGASDPLDLHHIYFGANRKWAEKFGPCICAMTGVMKTERMPYTGMRKFAGGCSGTHSAKPWSTTDGLSVSSGRYLVGIIWIRRNENGKN